MHQRHLARKRRRAEKKAANERLLQDPSRADFPTWEDYMLERVKRGLAAGYTFQECYQHWLDEFEATLYRLTDEAMDKLLQQHPCVITTLTKSLFKIYTKTAFPKD